MGVRGLMPLLARFAPRSITMPAESDLCGWTVAVDTNIYVQRFFRGTDGGADESRHLRGLHNMAQYMRSLDITPLFVFDGKARALGKEGELLRRREDRERVRRELERERARARRIRVMTEINARLLSDDAPPAASGRAGASNDVALSTTAAAGWLRGEIDTLSGREPPRQTTIDFRMDRLELEACRLILFRLGGLASLDGAATASLDCVQALDALQAHNAERVATLARRGETLTADKEAACVELVRALGFAAHVVEAGEESEGVCAQLNRHGIVDAVCSEDLDVVAFGGRLLRGFFAGESRQPLTLVDAQHACAELGLPRAAFIDLCILCGTDFSATLEKVGPVTALRLVREHGSIERILATGKYRARAPFAVDLARAVFLADPEPLPVASRAQLHASAGPPDPAAVERLLPVVSAPPDGSDPFARGLVL
ncbi:hypothetical protein H4S02_005412 [Coemansia sp. RSA 2611]|nr:hypothetical protein H4S02_005412 [Coemansia sp. RSA 2611]